MTVDHRWGDESRRRARLASDAFGPVADRCRRLPCCVCGHRPPSDPHHVTSRGAGGRDMDCVPLCRHHHQEGHQIGWVTFGERYGVDLRAVADRLASDGDNG